MKMKHISVSQWWLNLFRVTDIQNLNSDDLFLLIDSKGDSYSISFDIENNIFEIDNDHDHAFSTFCDSDFLFPNSRSKSNDTYNDHYTFHTKCNWNNYINNSIDNYLYSQIPVGSSILSGSANTNDTNLTKIENLDGTQKININDLWIQCDSCYHLHYKKFFTKTHLNVCEECGYHLKMSSSDRIELLIDPGTWNPMDEDMVSDPLEFDSEEASEDKSYKDWEEPSKDSEEDWEENLNWYWDSDSDSDWEDRSSKDWAEPSKDSDWDSDSDWEDKSSKDSEEASAEPSKNSEEASEENFKWYWDSDSDSDWAEPSKDSEEPSKDSDSEDKSYKDRIDSYQRETGLTEAVQTGIGQLDGIPVAIGVMDFEFMGGSMGSVVGEKITRLIEYASNKLLPLIIVCASGGARMQEGSLSLMQMAKIASVLYDYHSNKKLFYVSILTSPTTGGVTASFGMLGDIIIAEPNAYIAFAGKRVIEQLLNITVPEGSQEAEYLFPKGLFDPIIARNLLKDVLSELFQLHGFFPLKKDK
uniref:Acetyl-coenzyme A carboxylase carboxyl transferase subunit beta, chloroplastic n=1 Tax=Silene chalcedonica TaxID=39855 RepID=B6RRD4_SILCH|nr:acetyl-coA carboxylase beta subunit [Silene chalcedonica]